MIAKTQFIMGSYFLQISFSCIEPGILQIPNHGFYAYVNQAVFSHSNDLNLYSYDNHAIIFSFLSHMENVHESFL